MEKRSSQLVALQSFKRQLVRKRALKSSLSLHPAGLH